VARGESLIRQWKLLSALQSNRVGVCLDDLADIVGYNRRTVQRDLRMLQEAGFPLEHEADEAGKRFWRLPPGLIERQAIILSFPEAVSLYLARQLLAPLTGTLLAEGLDSLIQKIRSTLPQQALRHFEHLHELIAVRAAGQPDYRRHADQLRVLSEAVASCRAVQITYRGAWRAEQYSTFIHPYGIVFYGGELYVPAYSVRAGAIRLFKVSRISRAELSAQRFTRPGDLRLEDLFTGSFGIVRPTGGKPIDIICRFDGPVAVLVTERQWHRSQRIQSRREGSLLVRYRLGETSEFKRWIKGLGPGAAVLKPDWLRREIRAELLEAVRQHGGAR